MLKTSDDTTRKNVKFGVNWTALISLIVIATVTIIVSLYGYGLAGLIIWFGSLYLMRKYRKELGLTYNDLD